VTISTIVYYFLPFSSNSCALLVLYESYTINSAISLAIEIVVTDTSGVGLEVMLLLVMICFLVLAHEGNVS
jgi:hypothetical protein